MKRKDYTGLVPAQYTGVEIEAEAAKGFNSEAAAAQFYELAKQRLLNVNNWNKIAKGLTATFQIMESGTVAVDRQVKKGDYLKIDIPGPNNAAGSGNDWVFVEEMLEIDKGNIQSIGFRVRPTQNPFNDKKEVAHFYSKEATSNFLVIREAKNVVATIIDRNTKPNSEPENLIDKIRDKAVGIGAISVFSKLQWQNLAEGIISTD